MLRLPQGSVRPLLAVSLLAAVALAGCGKQERPATASAGSLYNRPDSYDPPGPPHDPWGPWIREASRRFDVPETWIREVMRQESAGRATATSRAGAMGLMQVMPGTYRELRARYGLGDDPYHPYDNIMAGAAYIREMYDLFGSPAFLAAYNAGPRRLEDYLWGGRGLPSETRNYVARVGPRIIDATPARRAPPEVYAAAEIPLDIRPGPRRMDAGTMMALREQRQRIEAASMLARAGAPPATAEPASGTALAAATPAASAPPQRVASVDPRAGIVVAMEPIPDGSTPEGAAALARARPEGIGAGGTAISGLPAPPPLPVGAGPPATRSLLAAARVELPQRRGAAPGAAMRDASATRAPAAAAPAEPQRTGRGGFSLMSQAQASVLPAAARNDRPQRGTPGPGWGVQVGAFSSAEQARNAANQARDAIRALGARTVVQPVSQGRSTLYRARVTGLSREAANAACERMRSRGGCMVLSPDAI
ncbi:hypothetical protein GCM10010964_23800 [Caldovatus sediminis]|uniref:SPOR domain-containing protein n=1 Tax=Caldovatus sediminis TaxID=2041189 RepID=A0A8J2ZC97_9PROT|nr:lytic transglycosylase domain-containing protein [Caldovatus sediminis]GGG35174.1 hypothetical protein GCM10010964_23800 [Caldovatus sediminis]